MDEEAASSSGSDDSGKVFLPIVKFIEDVGAYLQGAKITEHTVDAF